MEKLKRSSYIWVFTKKEKLIISHTISFVLILALFLVGFFFVQQIARLLPIFTDKVIKAVTIDSSPELKLMIFGLAIWFMFWMVKVSTWVFLEGYDRTQNKIKELKK